MSSRSPALPGDESSRIDDDDVGDLSLPVDQKRHLMELESSFHIDTDYGNISRLAPPPLMTNRLPPHTEESDDDDDDDQENHSATTANRRKASGTSRARSDSIADLVGDSSSPTSEDIKRLETLASSPTALAYARTITRAASAQTTASSLAEITESHERGNGYRSPRPSEIGVALERRPSSSIASSHGGRDYGALAEARPPPASTNPRNNSTTTVSSRQNLKSSSSSNLITSQAAPAPAPAATAPSGSYRRKPKILRSRSNLQRSSMSSTGDADQQIDDVESGNANANAEDGQSLSRQTSLGSIASGVTALGGSGSNVYGAGTSSVVSAADRALARLDEEERNFRSGRESSSDRQSSTLVDDDKEKEEKAKQKEKDRDRDKDRNKSPSEGFGDVTDSDDERPFTPKERQPPLAQPTETAVAAQVKNVKVPPTIIRQFSQHLQGGMPPGSPSKKAFTAVGTPAANRGREMTLKEQTASIDRLQKENFDLKIKVFYLNEKLEKQSDEGVKETLQENIDLKVKLAESMRERKSLKKRIRELEKKNEELGGERQREEEASAAAESEEIWELKERIEKYEEEIENFQRRDHERDERMREFRQQASNGHQANEEQIVNCQFPVSNNAIFHRDISLTYSHLQEQFRDMLTNEIQRREAQEAENLRLRDELFRLRSEQPLYPRNSVSRASNSHSVSVSERDRSQSRLSDHGLLSQLNEARRLNEELKRDLSAQTAMLTSRNREKDRLYAEIEDLKITMRGGGSGAAFESASRAPSVFSDRLLDRSVSRAGGTQSATGTHISTVTESEREEFENTNGELRDRISELRLTNDELNSRLDAYNSELEQRNMELDKLEEEFEIVQQELQEMQQDRDEALRQREEIEQDFEQLREEAEEEIQRLEEDNERLHEEVRLKDEDFGGLQQELRNVSDIVVKFEDMQETHQGQVRHLQEQIQDLERTIVENEQEMNALETTLRENTEKNERLSVQAESAKNEIQFLREEQDGDKIKIGQLESLIKQLEKSLEDEKDRVEEAKEQMEQERSQREQHGDIKQQEWERRLNEKTTELNQSREEIRRLKSKVHNREDEAKSWKEKLEDLEKGLREALGDLGGTKTGLMQVSNPSDNKSSALIIQSVHNLQEQLDSTLDELDYLKAELTEKDRNLKDRETLLESMALENRKLSDLLEKERNSHRADKHTIENLQTTKQKHTRKISEHEIKTSEIEKQRQRDAKTLHILEDKYREQINERNGLLMQAWQRLSSVCGSDWATRNSLVATSTNLPSAIAGKISMDEAIQAAFPGFSRNLLSAVKTIESIVAGFKTKCRGVERDLWKEYQAVENALDQRTRRIERLEALVRGGVGESSSQIRNEIVKLRTENRLLKVEVDALKKEATAVAKSPAPPTAAAPVPTTPTIVTPAATPKSPPPQQSQLPVHQSRELTEKPQQQQRELSDKPAPPPQQQQQSNIRRSHTVHVSTHTITTHGTASGSASGSGTVSPVVKIPGSGLPGLPGPGAPATGAVALTRSDSVSSATPSSDGGEKRWILRLRELEKRLKQEREARLLDRSAANKKIQESRGEKEEIKRELERARERGEKS
jgi:hypothetical protein